LGGLLYKHGLGEYIRPATTLAVRGASARGSKLLKSETSRGVAALALGWCCCPLHWSGLLL
jgi:hypothetical protein